MHPKLFICLAATLVLAGCAGLQRRDAFWSNEAVDRRRELPLIQGYCDPDITVAERSLLALIDYYSTLHVDGVGGTLALTHTRLFRLYSYSGQPLEAERHRRLALECYGGDSSQTEEEKWCDLLDAVERLDRHFNLKWKKEA